MRGGRSLAETLGDDLDEWSARTGISVETWALPDHDVPPRLADGIRRALREALANVERFSRARVVSVAITVSPSGLRMTVADDGEGTGWELAGLRAVFAELGGRVSANHVPGQGTTLTGVVARAR
ncbi:hypothetical protein ACIBH1_07285 [Nonomuraea sp. NPDC050663]|uniref:hypothetical protein n=1 Tax=Nonomuraea sp. NPDC050663 TaxID=3364370 RepID=UPI00379C780E